MEIILDIKGRPWKFILISDRRFDKLHNDEDGGNRAAVTLTHQYEVHFKKSEWCTKDIRHELGHVLYIMSLTGSVGLTPDQVEEAMCEIIGEHCSEIIMWSDRIAEKFFGRN